MLIIATLATIAVVIAILLIVAVAALRANHEDYVRKMKKDYNTYMIISCSYPGMTGDVMRAAIELCPTRKIGDCTLLCAVQTWKETSLRYAIQAAADEAHGVATVVKTEADDIHGLDADDMDWLHARQWDGHVH